MRMRKLTASVEARFVQYSSEQCSVFTVHETTCTRRHRDTSASKASRHSASQTFLNKPTEAWYSVAN